MENEVIDLTCDKSSAKRPRIVPPGTESESDFPPHLQRETHHYPTPSFYLTELIQSGPPILHPEVSETIKAEGTALIDESSPSGSQNENETHYEGVSVRNRRIARVSSKMSEYQKLPSKLNSTINALKNQSRETQEKNAKLKGRSQAAASTPNPRSGTVRDGRRKSRSKRTPEQLAILEAQFTRNPNPTPTEVFKLFADTNMSTQEIRNWFSAQRKKVGHCSDSNLTILEPENSAQDATFDFSNTSCTSTQMPLNQDGPKKFVRYPKDRIPDCELIRRDVNQVQSYSVDALRALLESGWEVKAHRILYLVTTEDEEHVTHKPNILKEAKRIVQVASNVNPFSHDQETLINDWKKKFIQGACERYQGIQEARIHDVVENAIMPWVGPYVYSKITTQNGRFLSLLVGVDDFCRISSSGDNWSWATPGLLQKDLNKL